MIAIYLLTDYKNRFGSKWRDKPYRSGFDKTLLADAFTRYGYSVEYIPFSNVFAESRQWKERLVLYTSSEEIGNTYKGYIEDIVYGLEEAGAYVLPRAAFLRANNNKVFMETMRENLLGAELTGLKSFCFGTLEELHAALQGNVISFPCVIKSSYGAMSTGVACAKSAEELCKHARIISRSPHYIHEFKEYVRSKKKSIFGYMPESRYQGKFIVQPMIEGLDGDWKVLVYGDQYYVLKRHVRPGDFRASGSHVNYLAGKDSGIPNVALDMVEEIYNKLTVPHLSVDVAYDGKRSYLIEFQAVYFGTSTQAELCEDYFAKQSGKWKVSKKTMSQEDVYAWGIAHYIRRHQELVAYDLRDKGTITVS